MITTRPSLKLKRAECTSDINTDVNEESIGEPPEKRQRFKPRKLLDSSSDEDTASSDLPRPPHITLTKNKSSQIAKIASRNPSLTYSIPERSPCVTGKNQSLISDINPSCTSSTTIGRNFYPQQFGNIIDTPRQKQGRLSCSKDFEETVLKQLLFLKEQNSKILTTLNSKTTKSAGYRIPELSVNLPVQSEEELDLICGDLLDDNKVSELSNYFSTIGGYNLVSKVNNILKRSLSNRVASQISFRGKTLGKRAFQDLKLKEALVGAAKLAHPSATEKEIEDCMKIWLKHEPQRHKTNMKRLDL